MTTNTSQHLKSVSSITLTFYPFLTVAALALTAVVTGTGSEPETYWPLLAETEVGHQSALHSGSGSSALQQTAFACISHQYENVSEPSHIFPAWQIAVIKVEMNLFCIKRESGGNTSRQWSWAELSGFRAPLNPGGDLTSLAVQKKNVKKEKKGCCLFHCNAFVLQQFALQHMDNLH